MYENTRSRRTNLKKVKRRESERKREREKERQRKREKERESDIYNIYIYIYIEREREGGIDNETWGAKTETNNRTIEVNFQREKHQNCKGIAKR